MKRALLTALVAMFLVVPVMADGPETGTVEGKVTDPQGTALPGVKVILKGDRGSQEGFTDASGTYRFSLLVPGTYTVRAELDDMQSRRERSAAVSAGGKVALDLELSLSTAEQITVTSEVAMVDKFSVTAGTTVSAEVGAQVAGSTRTYYGVINTMPGVTADAQNDDIQQTRPSVNGTHFADNNVFIDGVDTTFAKFGGSRVYLPTTAVTEVSMEAGGAGAEYGRSIGSQTNVIVKSGTNRYHIDGLIQQQKNSWTSEYEDHPSLTNREALVNIVDRDGTVRNTYPANWFKRTPAEQEGGSTGYEFSAGGPLRRDKAWFFVGLSKFDDSFQERLLGGDPYDVSLKNDARIFKFNLQPKQAQSLAFSFIDTPAFRNYFNEQSFDYWTPTPHENDSVLYTGNWNVSINRNFFLEAKLASQETQENKYLACGSLVEAECIALKQLDRGPAAGHSATNTSGGDTSLPLRFPANPAAGRFWPGNNYDVYRDGNNLGAWHNGWILSDGYGFNKFPREQANLALTQFIGSNHELKWGLDYQDTKWEGENSRPSIVNGWNFDALNRFGWLNAGVGNPLGWQLGQQLPQDSCSLLRTAATSPTSPTAIGGTTRGRSCYWLDHNAPELLAIKGSGDAEMSDTGFYVRDRFTVGDHWVFNLGARAEIQEGYNDSRRKVVDATYVDPRVGITYDKNGDGKLLFSLNWGRYHAMLNQAWIAGGSQEGTGMQDGWNGYNGHVLWLFCDPHDSTVACSGGRDRGVPGVAGYSFRWEEIIPGRMWQAVDQGIFRHDIDPYYKKEIILGMEWQFSRNWALDLKYINWDLEDMMFANTQIDQLGRNIAITGNYKNLPNIVRALRDARVANGLPSGITDDTINAFEQARNGYEGVQIQVNRRFADGFALYNNVSFSETDTTGAGAWWNNTNSDYGKNFEVLLNQNHIAQCNANQRLRTVPVDCTPLQQYIGQTASTILRRGPNETNDRFIIYNSFGYKTWSFGKQNLTLGGHLNFQTGTPWARGEGATAVAFDPLTNTRGTPNNGVGIQLTENGKDFTTACPAGVVCTGGPVGVRRDGRTNNEYTMNLSGAYGMPLGGKVRGELRLEVLNVTDQQKQREFDGRGEIYPVRRFFQRPRQARVSFKVSF